MWGQFPVNVIWQIKRWGNRPGKYRLYEAAWLGLRLREQGVTHLHTHFAGTGARTAWWIRKFYGISYSFTGHANDMFCPNDDPLSLEDLVDGAELVVTVSDFSREWLVKRCPVNRDKIHRIYNGIEISPLTHRKNQQIPPVIVSVGRAVEKKGFSDLIEACSILRIQGCQFRCQIIGGGPLEQALRDQIDHLGLSGFVELTGALPQEVVRKRLQKADLFALPCVSEADGGMDCLPTVILEAMREGLPVVSTNLAGVPELVRDGVTGILVGEREPSDLAFAIRSIVETEKLKKSMGLAGYSAAKEFFDVQKTVAQLCKLIRFGNGDPAPK